MKKVTEVPDGLFEGRNFITPNVLAYYAGEHDGLEIYVELSEGERIISRTPLWGVTVRFTNEAGRYPHDGNALSRAFSDLGDAHLYITNLSFPTCRKQ